MRRALFLVLPALLATSAAPAYAVGCVDASVIPSVCVPPTIRCSLGQAFTVTVIGHGTGIASCGNGSAACATNSLVDTCTALGLSSGSGTLSCSVDPYGSDEAVAICSMVSSI